MISKASTPEQYLTELPEERKKPMTELRKIIRKNLPKGFAECMNYGMLCYVVPHSIYPDGYHCDPKTPLPFLSIASQKNSINLYHMGIYGSPDLLKWFVSEFPKHSKQKLDMGKGCVRFNKTDDIPYSLIGELCTKITPEKWIEFYEAAWKKPSSAKKTAAKMAVKKSPAKKAKKK